MRFQLGVLACVVLAGLGGCGGSTNEGNAFFGIYSGTWTSTSGDKGTVKFSISQNGVIGGTLVDTTTNVSGTVAGGIGGGGSTTLKISLQGLATFSEAGTFTLAGQSLRGTLKASTKSDTYILSPAIIL